MVVARDIQRHALLAHARKIQVRHEDRFCFEDRTGEITPVRRDDGAAATEHELIVARDLRAGLFKFRGELGRAHERARREHEAASLERILAARHLVHVVHGGPQRGVHVFAGLVQRMAREGHPVFPADQ